MNVQRFELNLIITIWMFLLIFGKFIWNICKLVWIFLNIHLDPLHVQFCRNLSFFLRHRKPGHIWKIVNLEKWEVCQMNLFWIWNVWNWLPPNEWMIFKLCLHRDKAFLHSIAPTLVCNVWTGWFGFTFCNCWSPSCVVTMHTICPDSFWHDGHLLFNLSTLHWWLLHWWLLKLF